MKKIIMVCLILLTEKIIACDVCSFSASTANVDILNVQPQSYIQSSLTYKKFRHYNTINHLQTTNQIQNNWQIAYSSKKWVALKLTLPVVWQQQWYKNTVENKMINQHKAGLGDLVLQSNFNVLNKQEDCIKKFKQQLNFGMGFKFPTGKIKSATNDNLDNFIFGSQSFDFLFSALYSVKIKKCVLVNNIQYKLNTQNKAGIKYGNLISAQIMSGYSLTYKATNFLPSLGLLFEHADKNLHHNIIQPKSGYNILYLNYGLTMNIKQFLIDIHIQNPILEKSNNDELKQKSSISLILSISSITY